jgi:hypothetical protein
VFSASTNRARSARSKPCPGQHEVADPFRANLVFIRWRHEFQFAVEKCHPDALGFAAIAEQGLVALPAHAVEREPLVELAFLQQGHARWSAHFGEN